MKKKGQIVIGLGSIIALMTTMLTGSAFIFNSQASVKTSIRDVVEEVKDIRVEHTSDIDDINGKLDLLLKNFNLEYVPK